MTDGSRDREGKVREILDLFQGLRGKELTEEEGTALIGIVAELSTPELESVPDIVRGICEQHKYPRVSHLSAALRGRGQRDHRRAPTRAESDQRFILLARVKSFLREAGRLAHPTVKLRRLEFLLRKGRIVLTICPAESDDDSWFVYYHDPGGWVPEGTDLGMDIRCCTLNQSCMAPAFWAGVLKGEPPVEVVLSEHRGIEARAEKRCEAMAAQGTLRGGP